MEQRAAGRKLTEKGLATRGRIIEGAVREVRARGVAATTLDDVRNATRTSKSQLFHYFPEGKSGLLLAVARWEADLVLSDQQPYLDELTSWDAWKSWRDVVVRRYREQGQQCPLSTLLSGIGRSEPESRDIVVGLLSSWQERLATGIRRMRDQGEVGAGVDADRSAAALLAGLQGGVVVMLATGSVTHLEIAIDSAIEQLRASAD
ncbi:TetR/AcrR family transcriptional regulator [Streptomyces sp. AK02-01A]|uniref:TetR/AcrR family transcriptional regulator n=1 Tax=Streptomyces sp. AK02-01A TaxID=3028648 RepID=UPI0029AE3553|nr:TetR family transcriptional regulator [Streptomyces sp. AK02-01A]MDX3850118.1 TetR family transcriptional regulator [Streptomyces sp. AK02-01A]